GRPIINRLLDAGAAHRTIAHRGTGIVDAVADDRPAVIGALFDDVQFVAAARPMFGLPQPALRIEGEAFLAAPANGPDLGQGTGFADERIAGRGLAVAGDAHDLA